MLIDLTQFQSLIHKYCQDFSLDENKILHNLCIEDLQLCTVYPQFVQNLYQIDSSNCQWIAYASRYPHELLCRHTIPPRKTVCKVSLDVNHPMRDWDPPCAWEGFAALDYEICGPMLDKSVLRRDEEATMRCAVPHIMPIAELAHCYGDTCGSAAWAVMCAGYPIYWGQLIGWLDKPILPEMDEQFTVDLTALKETCGC